MELSTNQVTWFTRKKGGSETDPPNFLWKHLDIDNFNQNNELYHQIFVNEFLFNYWHQSFIYLWYFE